MPSNPRSIAVLIIFVAGCFLLLLAGCEETLPDTTPSFGGQTVPDQSHIVGEQIATLQLPAASGGDGTLTYALRPQVPGMAFDASARVLSGTPTAAGTYRMAYTVEDEDADSDTLTLTITIAEPDAAPSYGGQTVPDKSYTVGEQIATLQLPAASGGDGTLTYALRPQVPGMAFDASARVLSGTPTAAGTYRMAYTVEDEDADSDTLTFTITIAEPDAAPSYGGQTVPDKSYTVGEQIATVLPAASGGDGTLTYALRPQVPGMAFDASARVLSGTPTAAGTYRMAYTVEDEDADSDTLTFTITIAEPDAAPSYGGQTVPDKSYTVGEQIATVLPAASGGDGTLTYALRPQVPGMAFDASARVLSGTPTAAGTYRMAYTVEDEDADSDTLTFTITIAEPGETPTSRPDVILDAQGFRGHKVFHLNQDAELIDDRHYSLLLGTAFAQVYVISTNARHTTEVIPTDSRVTSRVTLLDPPPGRQPDAAARRGRDLARADLGPLPDRSWVQEYNANPPRRRARADNSQRLSSLVGPRPVAEGDRETFLDLDWYWNIVRIPATARRVVTDGSQTLAVWVADADWGLVRQEMVDALASRFLQPGSANDIYDWVTAAFGPPWGPHDHPLVIPPEAAQQVHILVFDIDGDGEDGGVLGFFFSKDLVSREWEEASNERVMFYLDSHWLARPEGPTWEVTDPAPEIQVETMAHEFQHIIYWYHKSVLHDQLSTIWLNEMTSMMAEDLISEKLPVAGPRGVAGNDPTAGQPGNRRGRLPLYNFFAEVPVTKWIGGISYSVNYALGAYLARTYGAGLFRSIVQSELIGVDAIEEALRARGHDVSFSDILVDWAVAGLLSDDTGARSPHRYNSGTWSTSSAGGLMFRLGSINLFNYELCFGEADCYDEGPWSFSLENFNESTARSPQPVHSNYLIDLGVNTGTVRMRISADSGNRFTVVVKDQ